MERHPRPFRSTINTVLSLDAGQRDFGVSVCCTYYADLQFRGTLHVSRHK